MRIRAAAAIAGLLFAGCPFPTKNWGRLRTPEMVEQRFPGSPRTCAP